MRYEWDEEKRRRNLAKHGLDFADVEQGFDWSTSMALPDETVDFETRLRDLGVLQGRTVLIVWVEKRDATRIISLRFATRRERRFYVENS